MKHSNRSGALDGHRDDARRKLVWSCCFAAAFMIAEFVGGFIAGSLAIMTDAAHMLTDVISFGLSLGAMYLSKHPATLTMTYGYKRAEVLGALGSILFLWILTSILVYAAILRIIAIAKNQEDEKVDGRLMFILAAIGLLVNIVQMKILGHGHSHSHGHNHGHNHGHGHEHHEHEDDSDQDGHSHGSNANGSLYNNEKSQDVNIEQVIEVVEATPKASYHDMEETETKKKVFENLNVHAAYIHVLGDLLQSLGVLIAGALIWAFPSWQLLDPIMTLVFSVIVCYTTTQVCKTSIHVLMEGAPREFDVQEVEAKLLEFTFVQEVHDLRIWSLGSNGDALSVHIILSNSKVTTDGDGRHRHSGIAWDGNDVQICYGLALRQIESALKEAYAFQFTTIQLEDDDYLCMPYTNTAQV
ncbi:Cation Diffusion Facilitator (CDF) Family [Thraustotheca clavata]|uniref:Cation Diffusion Facilitator (CDF) Family n=1 Tax=Thraustotheca clavata TaxID=74557 RepID=A0A1W0A1D5_9STRA|nr:Cation Diffusion Facilitator (CDF) Family [Thraustotheca clavata]